MTCEIAKATDRIGLVLGSGAARGWAHIGVIRALVEADIQVEYVAGTSIGSLVGAAFALGKMDALEAFARKLDWRQTVSFLDPIFPRSGLIDGKKVTDLFRSHAREVCIEDMPMPYSAVATDLATGREAVLDKGDLIDAIRASISVPGVFTPMMKDDHFLLDGGLVNPVPVDVVRRMGAEYVIAVDLNHGIVAPQETLFRKLAKKSASSTRKRARPHLPKSAILQNLAAGFDFNVSPLSQVHRWLTKDPVPSIFEVLTASIHIMETQVTTIKLAMSPCDMLIQPCLGHIRFMDFHRAEEAIAEGYRETMLQLERTGLK